jgi:zinc/manganese transport system permease protein
MPAGVVVTTLAIFGLFDHGFVQNAFIAGTAVALAAGLIGYFIVLRNQVFVSEVLSHVAFTGALAAYAFAIDPLFGLFASTIAFGLMSTLFGARASGQDVITGTAFAWVLGVGVLFLSIYTTANSSTSANASVSVLFGSIYGVDRTHALIAMAVCAAVVVATLFITRPLLFASLDPDVAAARGLPVRILGLAFVTLVAITVAEAVQVVGSLLVIGLIVTPAAAAVRVSTRPFAGMALSAAIAVSALWMGLVVNYHASDVPASFAVIGVAFAAFVASVVWGSIRTRSRRSAATTFR